MNLEMVERLKHSAKDSMKEIEDIFAHGFNLNPNWKKLLC